MNALVPIAEVCERFAATPAEVRATVAKYRDVSPGEFGLVAVDAAGETFTELQVCLVGFWIDTEGGKRWRREFIDALPSGAGWRALDFALRGGDR